MTKLTRRDAVKFTAGMVAGAGAFAAHEALSQPTSAEQAQPQPAPSEPEVPSVADAALEKALANPAVYMFSEQVTLDLADDSRAVMYISSALDVHGKPTSVRVPTGSVRVFRANAHLDEFTKQGGWYWNCGDRQGKAQFKTNYTAILTRTATEGPLVMVVRQPDGTVHWFSLSYDLRC